MFVTSGKNRRPQSWGVAFNEIMGCPYGKSMGCRLKPAAFELSRVLGAFTLMGPFLH